MREEISFLLGKGAVVIVEPAALEEGFYSTLFLVPKMEGWMRPVITLKALNFWVHPQYFKMEGIRTLRKIVVQDEWLAKLDLKDAYFTVSVHQEHRKFLRFVVDQVRYQFTCLPFGLSCAPWAFTKVLKPVTAFLRSLGVHLIVYIDDILIIGKSSEEVQNHMEGLIALLEGLGFIVIFEKSVLTPSQRIEFLGLQLDTSTMCLSLPGHKIRMIRGEAAQLLRQGSMSAHRVAQFIGKLNAASQALFPAPQFYRSGTYKGPVQRQSELRLYSPVVSGISGGGSVVAGAPEPVEWLKLAETSSAVGDSVRRLHDRVGAVCGGIRTGGPCSPEEQKMHINCWELSAATLAVQAFAKD